MTDRDLLARIAKQLDDVAGDVGEIKAAQAAERVHREEITRRVAKLEEGGQASRDESMEQRGAKSGQARAWRTLVAIISAITAIGAVVVSWLKS